MKPKAIILDIDGTLCDNRMIIHMLTRPNKDFHGYHVESINTPIHQDVLEIARQARMNGLVVLVMTARPREYRDVTYAWLQKHNVPMDELHMKNTGDRRPDNEVKGDMLAIIRQKYDVVHAVDDNPVNITLFKKENIGVTVIPGYGDGNYKGHREDNSIVIPSPIGSGKCLRCGRPIMRDALFGPDCAKTR
jgi:uncharacterized HAD superfamily protein